MSSSKQVTGISGKTLYLRLLSYVRPYWKQFALGIVFIIILALTEPLIPMMLKPLLDGTFVDKDPSYLFWSPIVLMLLFLVRGSSNLVSQSAFAWVSGKLVLDLRKLMFDRLLVLPTAYYDSQVTGNIVSMVTFNVNQVTAAATKVLMVLIRDSVTVLGLLAYMLYLNWKLSLLVFLLLPIIVIVVHFLAKRLRKLSRELQSNMGELTHVLEETVKGQKLVKVFGAERQEQARFRDTANWVRRLNFKQKVADAVSMPVVEGIAATMIALLIYVGTGQTGQEPLTVGEFVSFLAAMGLLFPPIKRLTGINQPLQRGLAAAETIFGLLDESPELDEGSEVLGRVSGNLAFQNVSFTYPRGEARALNEISFKVSPGETVALVGQSGSGKTTIAALIPRFYEVDEGAVLVDGHDTKEVTRRSLRDNISYVGQDSILFNDTVAANIAYGMKRVPDEGELRRVASDAHALEFIECLPDGFSTMVGEDGVRLSGGQRQRIAIARALLKDAPILILDEATSALDTASEQHVQEALKNLTENRSTIVIAHRLSTVEHADCILVLKQGTIIEQGTHAGLIAKGGEYATLYKNQFSNTSEEQ